MSTALIIFLLLLVMKTMASVILDTINSNYSKGHSGEVPESFKSFIDKGTFDRSIDYTVAKTRFGIINDLFDATILAVIILSGFLPWAYQALTASLGSGIFSQAIVLIVLITIISLPGIPFDWWHTFHLEDRFGFNKSTKGLWLIDKCKGMVLGFLIGCPLLALLLYLLETTGNYWWVWGFTTFFLFQIIMVVAYPMYIMPLFNKLEPLEAGSLKERLFDLAERTGFQAKTILKMDGSRRSTHSNAFFAGFGSFRRIVLYDTLIKQMDEEELEAVLAHEIGHYKLGHIPKMIALSALTSFLMFAVLGWLSSSEWFPKAFLFTDSHAGQPVPVLILFMLLSGLVTFWLTPLTSSLSRKHEYEADAFAREAAASAKPLVSALRKLHKENLSNLTPHPLYSTFHYSHPTLLERESALHQSDGR